VAGPFVCKQNSALNTRRIPTPQRQISSTIVDQVGVGEHGDMTAGDLMRCGAHAFGDKRSRSGCTVRSLVATMYELGFDLPKTYEDLAIGVGAI
jgi:hypothetical protein